MNKITKNNMNYIQKKIVISLKIPEGATHYEIYGNDIFWMKHDFEGWSRFHTLTQIWYPISIRYNFSNIYQIEEFDNDEVSNIEGTSSLLTDYVENVEVFI